MRISSKQKKEIAKIAKKHELKLVVLFGSFATGEAGKGSDYDIAILTGKKKIFDDMGQFSECLSDFAVIFGTNEDRIDFTNLNKANILLRHEIMTEGELLYGNRNLFNEIEASSFREFVDARSLFELESYLVKRRMSQIASR